MGIEETVAPTARTDIAIWRRIIDGTEAALTAWRQIEAEMSAEERAELRAARDEQEFWD